MATPKKIFQLVNRHGQEPLDIVFGDSNSSDNTWNYCDWDLNGNGHIRTITKEEATAQTALKAVFTEKQKSGYGTFIFDFIGEKDVMVRRTGLFMDITMCMLVLKMFNDEQAIKQDLSADDLLATVSQLVVTEDPTDPTTSKIQMKLLTNSGVETAIGVL